MKSSEICRFCDIVLGKYRFNGIDEPFASNDDFVAVASVGALVEGWSLIIPKSHELSMKNYYGDPALAKFLGSVLPYLVHHYGRLIAFEHGANQEGSITACGTAHAHFHLVPFGQSLLPEFRDSGMEWIKCHASEIAFRSREHEYLFYSELDDRRVWQDPVGYLHVLKRPTSQYFRRLIAKHSGKAEAFDYKRFLHLDVARQTRTVLVSPFA